MKVFGVSIKGLGQPHEGAAASLAADQRAWSTIRMSTIDVDVYDGTGVKAIYCDCISNDDNNFNGLLSVTSLRVDPLEGSSEFGKLNVKVQVNDSYNATNYGGLFAYNDGRMAAITDLIARFLGVSKPKRWGIYHDGLDMTDTDRDRFNQFSTMFVQRLAGRPELQVGQFIYLGREVMQVLEFEAFGPSGGISALAKWRLKVRRGACDTVQQSHYPGDYSDVEIFTDNHVVLSRDVEVWEYDTILETERLIFEGQLERPRAGDSMGAISLSAIGTLVQANNLRPGMRRAYWSWDLGATRGRDGQLAPIHTRAGDLKRIPNSAVDMVVERGGALIPVQFEYIPGGDVGSGLRRYQVLREFAPALGSFEDNKQNRDSGVAAAMKEVLLSFPSLSHFYDTTTLTYFQHPFDILRCLLCSRYGDGKNGKYDCLPDGWGMGYPTERINHDAIDALKEPVTGWWYIGSGVKIESFLIGAESSTFRDIIERLLRPLMCFLCYDDEHKLTIKPFIDPGPDFVDLNITEEDIVWSGSETSQDFVAYDPRREIRYTIARRGASSEYAGELLASTTRKDIGSRFLSFGTDEEIDARDYGRPDVSSSTNLDQPSMRALMQVLTMRWEFCNGSLHKYQLRLAPGTEVKPGDIININARALFDPDTAINGVSNARCMCLSADIDPNNFEVTVEVINLGVTFRSQFIVAPMFLIGVVNSQTNLTISNEWTTDDISYLDGPLEVTVYGDTGLEPLQATYGVRTATRSGSNIILSSAFGFTVFVGQIIGPALYPQRDKDRYAYIADEIGEFSNNDEGHSWGY